MILFFTFDVLLVLGFIIMFVCILVNGVASVLSAITTYYAVVMIITYIISIIASFSCGVSLSEINKSTLSKKGGGEWQSAIAAVLYAPPVFVIGMNEIFGLLDMLSKTSVLEMIILGVVYVVILLIAVTLFLIIGLGLPIGTQYLLSKWFGEWASLISGIVFGGIYYYLLYSENIFPFSMTIN